MSNHMPQGTRGIPETVLAETRRSIELITKLSEANARIAELEVLVEENARLSGEWETDYLKATERIAELDGQREIIAEQLQATRKRIAELEALVKEMQPVMEAVGKLERKAHASGVYAQPVRQKDGADRWLADISDNVFGSGDTLSAALVALAKVVGDE